MHLELFDADFDAFAPDRPRTTAASRGATKRRILAWMKALAEALAGEGVALEVASSDAHASSRNGHRAEALSAFLYRKDTSEPALDAERPEQGHARLELRLDANAVALFAWLGGDARADLERARAMLAQSSAEVARAWDALGAHDAAIEPRASLSMRARKLRALSPADAAVIAGDALESQVPLVLGVRAQRAVATKPHALDPWSDVALALGRLLKLVAWSAESIAIVAAQKSERPSRRGRRALDTKRVAAPAPQSPPPIIEGGTRVNALAGPFAGQSGVVQELDGKGGARVLFGLLAARVELSDLTVAATKSRGRPILSSSHRKPST